MRIFWFIVLGLPVLAGCQMAGGRIIPSPLTYSEQEREILAIVPQGTGREEAVHRLSAAGIEGDFGSGRNIYYCDLWKRENGDRWHINVALLFDKSGKLYKTQVAQADTGLLSSNSPTPAALKSTASTGTPALGTSAGSGPPSSSAGSTNSLPAASSSGNSTGNRPSDAWRASTDKLKIGRELHDGSRR